MEPANIRFGGGVADTLLHPFVAVSMVIAILLILLLPRSKAVYPFLLAFFTIPLGQVVVLGGLHFPVVRILILAGVFRAAFGIRSSGPRFAPAVNGIDVAVILWTISGFVIVSLQWMELPAFVKFVGDFLDSLGGYITVRFLIPDREALFRTIKALALVCLIQGVCMIDEHFTRKDIFGYLGGLSIDSVVRDGHVRAGGLLGTIQSGAFAGPLIPLFLWLWTSRRFKIAALAGLIGATAMVVASYTSTSFMAYGAGLFGLAFWPLRKQMRLVRWGIVIVLLGLQLVMNGPVWSLIEHIDVAQGSSSYHRYQLVDTLIRHFGEWWLLGTTNNGSWGWEMWDTCNQFVAVAVTGGLLTLLIYILILKRGFREIGNARKRSNGDRKEEWFLWSLGSAMFATVVAQFGINYMIQLQLVLFALLACTVIATSESQSSVVRDSELPDQEHFATIRAPQGAFFPLARTR